MKIQHDVRREFGRVAKKGIWFRWDGNNMKVEWS